jgi:hypothetical protein
MRSIIRWTATAAVIALMFVTAGIDGLTWLAYDLKNDVLYLMKMGSDLFKLARGRSAVR